LEIVEIAEVTDGLVSAFERLIPQLGPSIPAPTRAELAEIVSSDACTLFVAREDSHDGEILGALTLTVFRIPTGVRAWIEDVVVDESARRRGIGTALTRAALVRAAALGAGTVYLTSRPAREAANRLYRRLGFVERETNVYQYMFDSY
jgi:ribosomal protein S18 acetylase RimI-like enzyme